MMKMTIYLQKATNGTELGKKKIEPNNSYYLNYDKVYKLNTEYSGIPDNARLSLYPEQEEDLTSSEDLSNIDYS